MQNEIRSAIYNVLESVFSPVYFHEAKQGTEAPYCVFDIVSAPVNRDTATQYEEIYFQFVIYGKSLAGIEADKVILDASLRDPENFDFDSFEIVTLIQMMHIKPRIFSGLWQVGSQFKIEVQPI